MDPVQELKETCEKIGRAFEEFKAENNKLIAKGVKDVLAEMKLDTLGQAIDDLTGKKEDLEKRMAEEAKFREELERKFNKLSIRGNPEDALREQKHVDQFNREVKALARTRGEAEPADLTVENYNAYKAAFVKYARKGADALSAEERKAMSVGNDADGGFLVLPDLSGRIAQKVFDLSPIRSIANVQNISSDALEGIEDLGEASAGWVAELGSRSDSNTPQVGRYRIEAMELYAMPKASQKLLDDSSVDIEAWLAGKVADKFARTEGAAFCVGNGVGQPHGLAAYSVANTGDATRAWGVFEAVQSGASADFAASNPADKLFDLIQAFKPAYLQNAKWLTRRSVIAKIRKFKEATTNAYMWQPGLQQGQPAQLLGYPIVLAEDMPALAADSLSLALGDFNLGYQIVDRLGVRMLRDPYTDKPNIRFYTIKRTGGAAANFEAIKFVRFNT